MGDWRLLDPGHETGMQQWFMHDAEAGKNYIRYEQDPTPLLDACKNHNNHADRHMEIRQDMVHVGSILPSVQMKWLVEYGVDVWNPDHQGAVNRLLDGEYKHLKRLPIWLGDHDTAAPPMKYAKRVERKQLPAPSKLIGFDNGN